MFSASNGSAATTLKSAQSAYELHQAFSHELREECLYTGPVHGLGVDHYYWLCVASNGIKILRESEIFESMCRILASKIIKNTKFRYSMS